MTRVAFFARLAVTSIAGLAFASIAAMAPSVAVPTPSLPAPTSRGVYSSDIVAAANDVRLHGCRGSPGGAVRLRESSKLDDAARRLSRGDTLHSAAASAGYRATKSASVRITNVPDTLAIERVVARQFCSQVIDRGFREIGASRRGPDVWLVLAAPFSPPGPADREAVSRRVLDLTNEVRARGRACGNVSFPPAPPLELAPALESAALEHSADMAAHDDLDHIGHDGSTPADRVSRAGYKWRIVGENVASGVTSAEEAVSGWAASPHHCENLMSPRFSQMAVAYAVNNSSSGGVFWTQVFGSPR